ncbi:hypothetical protein ACJJTC_010861, partial [Scirpophaga incertulas]
TQATEESSSTDGQLDANQEQHSSSSNVTMNEGFPPSSNSRTTLKRRRSSNPPELKKATEQMQDALKTMNTVLNKSAQKEDNMCDIYGKLIASKLKKYFSDIEQHEVMFELHELLTKKIRNSLKLRSTSPLSAMSSTGSFDSTSPVEMHRPSSSQTFYVLPDSPVQIPKQTFSSQSYPIFVPQQNNIFNQSMTLSSPQHEQLQQPTDQQNNQVHVLSDEVVDSARLKPILQEAFFKAMSKTLKDSDKCRAENSHSVIAVCYDLQKILNTPQSEVSVFYYKRKLACYNFTLYDMGKHKGYCYFWDETIGRKGSNEISSFVFDFIKTKVQEGYKEFNFYSDSCGGQNKNKTVFAMYAYASTVFKITINHHFFEVGHSQSEGDAMHALIERRKKNKIIYIPQQWIALIRCAKSTGEPYVVKEVNQDSILDFKQLLRCYNNWEYDVNNVKVSWSKIMHIRFICDLPNIIKFQYDSLTDNEMAINIAQHKTVSLRSVTRRAPKEPQCIEKELPNNILQAYNSLLPITIAKYKDIISLCKSNAIPAIYHDYYINLPHVNSIQANNNESDSN